MGYFLLTLFCNEPEFFVYYTVMLTNYTNFWIAKKKRKKYVLSFVLHTQKKYIASEFVDVHMSEKHCESDLVHNIVSPSSSSSPFISCERNH